MTASVSPKNWVSTDLGSILELKYGKSLPAKDRDGEGAPVYGSNGIVGLHSSPFVQRGGVVVGRKGSFGEVHISTKPFSPIDTTYYIDETWGLPLKYWYYQLRCLPLTQLNRSSAIPGLNREDAYAQEITLPPLAEQQQIATRLDALLAQVDILKNRLNNIPFILKRFRHSVLTAAVSGRLTDEWREEKAIESVSKEISCFEKYRTERYEEEIVAGNKETKRLNDKINKHTFSVPKDTPIPDTWSWTSFMGSMEKIVDCHNKTAPYVDEGIYLIRTNDIRHGRINLENTRFVDQLTYEYWSRRCPPSPGDILFTREAPMGEAGIVPAETTLCMGQRIMLLRPIPEFTNPKYVLFNIMSLPFQERMSGSAMGTGVKHLRVADVESLTYPLASIAEQNEIVCRVEQLFAFADKIEQRVKDAQSRANHLSHSILAKAFRGELTAEWREQNPDLISGENSAEALLARIKTEKAEAASVKKTNQKCVKTKADKNMKPKMIIPVAVALKAAGTPLAAQALLTQSGYSSDATTEDLERFFLDIREQLNLGSILRERSGDDDIFTLLN